MLKKIFGLQKEERTGYIILHDEELHNLYCSRHIVMVIKSRKIRWACMHEEMRNQYRVLVRKP
jgi:hypothetical protein